MELTGDIPPTSNSEMGVPVSFNEFLTHHPHPNADSLNASRVAKAQALSARYEKEPVALADLAITDVSWANLDKAVQFVREQFSYDVVDPAEYLIASLTPDDPDALRYLESIGITNTLKYWVTVNDTGDVLGISGLYEYRDDDPDTVWLGWSVVEENVRQHGLFKKIASQLVTAAREAGKKWIKLYTSTDEHEAVAQTAYDKMRYFQLEPGNAGYPSQAITEQIMGPYQGDGEPRIIIRGLRLDQ